MKTSSKRDTVLPQLRGHTLKNRYDFKLDSDQTGLQFSSRSSPRSPIRLKQTQNTFGLFYKRDIIYVNYNGLGPKFNDLEKPSVGLRCLLCCL